MKKILLSLILGLGLAFFTVMEAAAAQPAAIRVHGHSKIEADPEVAFLTVKFTASDLKDTSKARMQLERIFSGVIARLRQLNIRDGDLIAQDIETSGNHDAQSKCGQNEEYSVSRSLTVSVYDLSMLDRVVDIVLDGQHHAETSDKRYYAHECKSQPMAFNKFSFCCAHFKKLLYYSF